MGWRDDRDDRDHRDDRDDRDDDRDYDIVRGRGGRRDLDANTGWGLTSFVISIIAGIGLLGMVVVAGIMVDQQGGQLNDRDPAAIILGFAILGGLAAAVVGLVLGFMTVTQSRHNIVLAVLGIVFNALIIIGVIGLMCIGLAVG